MLPPDQHRALREHGALVDGYWSSLEREKERLLEPHKERLEQLDEIYRSGVPRADPDTGSMGLMAHVSRAAVEAHDETQTIHNEVEELASWWAVRNNPKVEPFDSPSRFVAWIDREMFDARYLEENRHRYQPLGDPSILSKFSYESIYHRARERMMSFLELAPDLVLELPERDEPRRGLREIRNLFFLLTAREPGAIVTVPQVDDLPPSAVHLSESEWLPTVRSKLSALIEQARRTVPLLSGSLPEAHKVMLWQAVDNLEAALEWPRASGYVIPPDVMTAWTWLGAFVGELPAKGHRLHPENDPLLAALIAPDRIDALEQMLGLLKSPDAYEGTQHLNSEPPLVDRTPPAKGTEGAKPKQLKQPKPAAFAAYFLYVDHGWDQTRIAERLSEETGRIFYQGTISRMVSEVRRWREAGNPWPDTIPKFISTDPSRLDLGPRERK